MNSWQLQYGYSNSIDHDFTVVAPNTPIMFAFQYGKKSYAIWAWKGNYPAFGDGGEVEWLSQDKPLADIGPWWNAHANDPNLPKMTESVSIGGSVIASSAPTTRQTWPASWNPKAQDMNVSDLQFTATITFGNAGIYTAFMRSQAVQNQMGLFTPDPDHHSVTMKF